jgi:bromodomain-containing factor 1
MSEPAVNGNHIEDVKPLELNGHAMQVDVLAPTNGINGNGALKSPSSPSSRRSPPEPDDDSQPPPAKRPRTLSEEDQFNNDSVSTFVSYRTPSVLTCSAKSATAVASPLPIHGPPSSAAPSPETPAIQTSLISPNQHRFCLSTVRTLKKLKDAPPFLKPVDPIALNIPHYPTIVKHPMDLGTVEQKLLASKSNVVDGNSADRYYHVNQFVQDVKLVFQNCYDFNGHEHLISMMAKRLEAVFDKQIKQMPPTEEVRFMVLHAETSGLQTRSPSPSPHPSLSCKHPRLHQYPNHLPRSPRPSQRSPHLQDEPLLRFQQYVDPTPINKVGQSGRFILPLPRTCHTQMPPAESNAAKAGRTMGLEINLGFA